MKSILSIGLLAVIALILHHALIEKPELERRQKHEIEMKRLERAAQPPEQVPVVVTEFVRRHSQGDLAAAQQRLERSLSGQPSLHDEVHVTIERHLSPGHLLVSGAAFDPAKRVARSKLFTIFGVPNAGQIPDGEQIDLFAVRLEPMTVGDSTLDEYLFMPAGERRLARFGTVIRGEPVATANQAPVVSQTPEQAAALVAQAMAPLPKPTPARALTPAEQNAEIARKYGTR